ncbi:U6 snRNA phosphodiesterase isoform X2 [Scyliorhinus canicula]|uniref:U6 snRNA phosphodiesterase isoform X2 n=1 Tax=Scyliorhinus canicula TaxID=7830 RepID=UPI0018F5D630|nr:U6 snRNA phosphodiesterase isoform X2 [Scyliorhinus canicula]
MLLVNYSSSSEEEEGPAGEGPRRRAEGAVGGTEVQCQRLPVPESVMGMFKELEEELDDSVQHDGRIRSFPHQRGNWSTLVYLEYYPEVEFVELIDLLLTHLQMHNLPMARLAEFHISLSQTVVLRYHWINIFVESLKEKMTSFDRFYCVSDKVKIYINQENTRTFLGLEVSAGSSYLQEVVNEVDKSMKEFDLKTYYKKPSFHISVAWCLGDVTAELEKHQQELQAIVDRFENGAKILRMFADQVRCKTGNKIFSFPLR